MISAGEFRNGVTFEQDGQVLQVVEFQHVKPGKGAAFVRVPRPRTSSPALWSQTTTPPQSSCRLIERKDVTYSYEDGDLYHYGQRDLR